MLEDKTIEGLHCLISVSLENLNKFSQYKQNQKTYRSVWKNADKPMICVYVKQGTVCRSTLNLRMSTVLLSRVLKKKTLQSKTDFKRYDHLRRNSPIRDQVISPQENECH